MATVMPDGKVDSTLPTMYDLPSEAPEEPGLPDELHLYQAQLPRETFQPSTYRPERVFVGSDLNLYYSLDHTTWYKRPDWFAALGVSRLYQGHELRLSYVVWQEAAPPYLVVELLSPGKEQEDLGKTVHEAGEPPTKWMVYEQILSVPYYVVFNPRPRRHPRRQAGMGPPSATGTRLLSGPICNRPPHTACGPVIPLDFLMVSTEAVCN